MGQKQKAFEITWFHVAQSFGGAFEQPKEIECLNHQEEVLQES